MMRSPPATASRTHASVRSGVPMASRVSSARLGAPPCSGPESAPSAATTAAPTSAPVDVTTRAVNVERVEAVVDAEDLVLLDRARPARIGDLAVDHPEVVRRRPQLVARRDERETERRAVQPGDEHRGGGTEPERVGADGLGIGVVGRRHALDRGELRQRGAQRRQRVRVPGGDRRQQVDQLRREVPRRRDAGGVGVAGGDVRELALEQQVPDVLERALLRRARGPSTGGSGRSLRALERRRARCRRRSHPSGLGGRRRRRTGWSWSSVPSPCRCQSLRASAAIRSLVNVDQ